MDATSSHLSAEQYGYDFVLSTTQASINAGLMQYLDELDQPEQTICYLADPNTGNPKTIISLDELVRRSGVNPFEFEESNKIPTEAVKALTEQRFIVGIRIKIGLPPDVELSKLPPVVTLGDGIKQIRFNMLTNVNLKIADLDNELNTPYFNNHPQERQAILDQLKNLSGSAFNLQQLFFDLDNASLQSNLSFAGIDPNSNAYPILQKSFINLWAAAAAEKGQPLVCFERAINPPRDEHGAPIKSPDQRQSNASTMDCLCAVDHRPLPQPSPFQWNWLQPDQIENMSGIVAINRATFAGFLKNRLVPAIKQTCFKPHVAVENTAAVSHYAVGLIPGDSPQTAMVTNSDDHIIHIEHSNSAYAYKDPKFSDHQDLVCPITYVDPGKPLGTGSGRTRPLCPPQPPQDPAASEPFTLTASTDLIENYLQGHLVSPTGKFEALQTADGHGLVFSTDSEGVFSVIEEKLHSTAGWTINNLSAAVIHTQFPGKTNARVSVFSVGQSAVNGSISLAMGVRSGNTDTLFVSLGNSNAKLAWIENPSWTQVPFDAKGGSSTDATIRGIMFAEASREKEYLVVDIDRASQSSVKMIERYHVDMTKADGHYWVKHDVPVDISSEDYKSCIGRRKKGRVDGVYTSGQIAGKTQLFYVPIVNFYGQSPPSPCRLYLPNGEVPSAIASARNGHDTAADLHATTDLYVVSDSKLYRFAADNQADGRTGTLLLNDDVFSQTATLIAMTRRGVTTIWGKNGNNEVYYLSCPTSQLALPGSWSAPVPILTGIEHISAFVNDVHGGNAVFASGGNNLFKIEQASLTGSKLWKPQKLSLASKSKQKAISYKSYTSTLLVRGRDGLPARKATVSISTTARTPVFINGLYYVLSQTPVNVLTDSTGSVTVVEATEDINAAVLTVSCDGGFSQEINPMSKSFDRITSLSSEDALRDAKVPKTITAGGVVGSVESIPIINASTSSQDLQEVAAGLERLQDVHTVVQSQPESSLDGFSGGVIPATLFYSSGSVSDMGNDIAIAIGDLFQWLKTGVEHFISIVKESDVWHFVANIAGKVYRAILDTVEAVVGVIEWVFDKIKTAIEDLVRYVQFLIDWDDISRTKSVISNIVRLYIQAQVEAIPEAKKFFNTEIDGLKESLAKWADMDHSSLGEVVANPASSSASDPMKDQTSGSQLLSHHFRNNAEAITTPNGPYTLDGVGDDLQNVIDALLAALSKEGKILSTAYAQLQDLAKSFTSMSVSDALKQLFLILGDAVLDSVEVVVDVVMDVLNSLAHSVAGLLDTKIHIPVISDILSAIGVTDISIFDLFMWIVAAGFTVVYKITQGAAPFPENSDTQRLSSATSRPELSSLFSQHPAAVHSSVKGGAIDIAGLLPQGVQEIVFLTGHLGASFFILMGDFFNVFEAEALTGDNPYSLLSAILGIVAAGCQGSTDFLVPKFPVKDISTKIIGGVTTTCTILSKLVFSGLVQKRLAANSWFSVNDGRATGAIVNTILIIPALYVSCRHFYELSRILAGKERSAAIIGEVSNIKSYVSRISYAIAVNDYDEESRNVVIAIMALSNVATSGLQFAEAVLLET